MRLFLLSLFFFLSWFLLNPYAEAAEAGEIVFPCPVTSTLRLGMTGTEVKCLQDRVGVTPDGKFGPITETAVRNFQAGNDLTADGIVGPLTRTVLSGDFLANSALPADGCAPGMNFNPLTGIACGSKSPDKAASAPDAASRPATVTAKPEAKVKANLTNLDKFIDTVVADRRKHGDDDKKLATIATTLRQEVLNSEIDFQKEFETMLEDEAKLSVDPQKSLWNKFLAKVYSVAKPREAQALTGVPFGGWVIFTFYCAASSNWLITLTPYPPSYAVLLSYTPFTQGFASYNTPYTRALLGEYSPPGVCSYGYVNIPTYGVITPMTGSSPTP